MWRERYLKIPTSSIRNIDIKALPLVHNNNSDWGERRGSIFSVSPLKNEFIWQYTSDNITEFAANAPDI